MPRACLILLSVLSLTGCDILGTSKVDNPVFGPPPPRVGMADPPQESRFAKNFPGKSDTDGRVRMVDFDTTRDKLASTSELAGTQVVATVNGSPIFASEVLEPFGADLRKARQQLPPEKFEEARLGLIQSQLKSHILRKLLAERLRSTLEKEQLERLDQAINAMYDDHVNGLKKQFKVNTEHEVDLELQKQQDTSLARLKNGFAVQAMAAAYREGKVEPKLSLGRPELLAYYESHPEEFDYPTRIHWRYLTVMFEKHGGREKALARLEQAVNKLRANEPFAAVAESFSDAPNAKQGGDAGWSQPESLADDKIRKALEGLQEGTVSRVIEGSDSFRLVYVEERQEAGRVAFDKVHNKIKKKLENQAKEEAEKKVLDELMADAIVETIFDKPAVQPETKPIRANVNKPSANAAGVSRVPGNRTRNLKKSY